MQRDCPNPEAAADVVAHRASQRIFAKVLPMALTTTAQYFDDAEATWRMDSDLGRKGKVPLELIDPVRQYFSFDVKPIAFADTITLLWFQHARWWFTACFLLAPLVAIGLAMRAAPRCVRARSKAVGARRSWPVFQPVPAVADHCLPLPASVSHR
jgi:hypothetical protein